MKPLSKSRLLSYLQCPKKLWLEVHRPGLALASAERQARFDVGHAVGSLARQLYNTGHAAQVEYSPSLAYPIRKTQQLLAQPDANPIFEATFEHAGVLVRIDVLERSQSAPRFVEVKAATEVKEEYIPDCAIQTWVLDGAGLAPRHVAVAHIDKTFVYQGDGNYRGLLKEADVTGAARLMSAEVPKWSRTAQTVLARGEPATPVGRQCRTPYECPFISYCWPKVEYPLSDLPRLGMRLDEFVARGYRDIRELTGHDLPHPDTLLVWQATKENRVHLGSALREELQKIPYPRHYLDFETIQFAIPVWTGTRPYQQIPFQWSIHYENAAHELVHFEHLNLSAKASVRFLAQSLIAALGTEGPILTYSAFEKTCIRTLAELVPELAEKLRALEPRLIDLLPIVKRNYYHPAMHGSWSIKAVLPTVVPDMRYEDVGEVQDGTAAQRAYLEAIDPKTTEERREAIASALRKYCGYDTEAMVRIVRNFEQ